VVQHSQARDGFDERSDVSAHVPVAKDGAALDHDLPQRSAPSVRVAGVAVEDVPVAFGDAGAGAEIEIRGLTPGERRGHTGQRSDTQLGWRRGRGWAAAASRRVRSMATSEVAIGLADRSTRAPG
jgi:hypothetical protein